MIKLILQETITIGQGDAGRYEYQDITGVVEAGDKVIRATVDGANGREYLHFKSQAGLESFMAKA